MSYFINLIIPTFSFWCIQCHVSLFIEPFNCLLIHLLIQLLSIFGFGSFSPPYMVSKAKTFIMQAVTFIINQLVA